jgi:hypothetical protein
MIDNQMPKPAASARGARKGNQNALKGGEAASARLVLRVTPTLLAALDAQAQAEGVPRSEIAVRKLSA